MPRNKDPVWANFDCITTKNSGLWARCKKCKKEMQGILDRMRRHVFVCQFQNARDPTAVLPDKSLTFSSTSTSIIQFDTASCTSSDIEGQRSKEIVLEAKMEILMLKKRIIEQEYEYNKLMYEHRLKMNELELQQNMLKLELLQKEMYTDDNFVEHLP